MRGETLAVAAMVSGVLAYVFYTRYLVGTATLLGVVAIILATVAIIEGFKNI